MKKNLFAKPALWFLFLCLAISYNAACEDALVEEWLDASDLLEGHELLFAWTERSSTTADTYIHGCRLEPLQGQMPFDVYFDGNGALLDEHDLNALGITAKQWDYVDVNIPAVVSSSPVEVQRKKLPGRKVLNAPLYTLEALDHERLLEEDMQSEASSPDSLMRYGVNRYLVPPVEFSNGLSSTGVLDVDSDGSWQWEVKIHSTGAQGLRLCFEQIEVPTGVELFVYNTAIPSEFYGPIECGHGVWSPSIINDTLGIICRGASTSLLDAVTLKIDRLIHIYRSPLFLDKEVGDCHIDVACRPEWAAHASAVGRLGLIDFDAWACTGALIAAPGYSDSPPFLLTANHCISLQAQATTLEIWWFYHRENCGDDLPPDMESVPRSTGGATLLAGANAATGSDFSLLLLKEDMPVATTFLGYTTRSVSIGESVVCIHHPQGLEKRISFGISSDMGSPRLGGEPLASRDYFHEVLWQEATTEGGSSGSPLLLADTGEIIGQLYGGYASCTTTAEPDYFGRMDITYPLIVPWLSGEYAIEGEIEGEGEGEGEAEGEVEGELEGEREEGETEGEVEEGEVEGEGEAPDSDCFFGLIQCSTETTVTFFHYAEVVFKILMSLLGLWLARYLSSRSRT